MAIPHANPAEVIDIRPLGAALVALAKSPARNSEQPLCWR
jgi:hypothetical protein